MVGVGCGKMQVVLPFRLINRFYEKEITETCQQSTFHANLGPDPRGL